jgi:hypothetical protein
VRVLSWTARYGGPSTVAAAVAGKVLETSKPWRAQVGCWQVEKDNHGYMADRLSQNAGSRSSPRVLVLTTPSWAIPEAAQVANVCSAKMFLDLYYNIDLIFIYTYISVYIYFLGKDFFRFRIYYNTVIIVVILYTIFFFFFFSFCHSSNMSDISILIVFIDIGVEKPCLCTDF